MYRQWLCVHLCFISNTGTKPSRLYDNKLLNPQPGIFEHPWEQLRLDEKKWAKSSQAFLPCEFSSELLEDYPLLGLLFSSLSLSLFRPVTQPTHELKRGEDSAGDKGRGMRDTEKQTEKG